MRQKKNRIETDRLVLRDVVLDDVQDWFEIFSSERVVRFIGKCADTESAEKSVKNMIGKYQNDPSNFGSSYSAVEKKSGKVIGNVTVRFNVNTKEASLGYVFNDKFWNMGYATESAFALIDYAFNHLGAEKVVADCVENNDASNHVLKNKLGMVFVRHDPKHVFDERKGCYVGFNFFELTKCNYPEKG